MGSKADCNSRSIIKGLVSGLIGGLVATFAMTQVQNAIKKLSHELGSQKRSKRRAFQSSAPERLPKEEEPATEQAASAIAQGTFGRELSASEKKTGGSIVHYAMGAGSGAIYGAFAEISPKVTEGDGMGFGSAVWLVADEIAVPGFGLSKMPMEYPASVHAKGLAVHLVYGLITESVRRAVRGLL